MVAQYTYTGLGKVKEKKQQVGGSWLTITYEYDQAGRINALDKPLEASSYFSYDLNSNWVGYTDAEGNETIYGYDDLNQMIGRTNATGVITEYTLDDLGRGAALTEAKDTGIERTIEFEYGNFDLQTKIWGAFNSQTLEATFSYDLFGDMTAQTDANGNGTSYTYDYLNRRTGKTNAEMHSESYSYDTVGNWTGLTDPNGNFTRFVYTANNELQGTTYPDFTTEYNIYDAAGNRTSRITRAGKTIAFEYDDFNRVVKKIFPDSSETTYGYDSLGRMTAAENDDSVYTYAYNDLYQLTQVDVTLDSEDYMISYEYDKVGNKTRITYPESYYYYSRTYDALNRLDLVKDRDNSNIADYTYDDLNRRTRRDYLNTTWTTYTYNDIGWLTDLVNWRTETDPISSFVYTHDNVGNRLTMTSSFGTQTYSYDKIYQVTGADYPAGYGFSDMTYQYDACWNRETTVNDGTTNYLTNSLNQYSSVGGTSYSYDGNGNLTTDGTQTYYYNCENQLTQVVRNSNGQTLGEYRYDPFGKRIRKEAGGIATNYVYDHTSYQVLAEYKDGGGGFNLAREFVYGVKIDEPLVMVQDEERYFYYRDGLGSVVGLTNTDGDTVKEYDYAVYGDFTSSGSLTGNPYTFTGRSYDPESMLFYYRARMYSQELGRFLQVDPLGYSTGPNLYAYVRNNSINYVDSSGFQEEQLGICCDADEIIQQMLRDMLAPKLSLATITASRHEDCARNAGRQAEEKTKGGSPLRHCITHCLIVGQCGASVAEAEEMGKEYERYGSGNVFEYLRNCKNKDSIIKRIQCQYNLLKDTQADLVANRAGAQFGAEGASNFQDCWNACLPDFPNEPQFYPVTDEFMKMLRDYHQHRHKSLH